MRFKDIYLKLLNEENGYFDYKMKSYFDDNDMELFYEFEKWAKNSKNKEMIDNMKEDIESDKEIPFLIFYSFMDEKYNIKNPEKYLNYMVKTYGYKLPLFNKKLSSEIMRRIK